MLATISALVVTIALPAHASRKAHGLHLRKHDPAAQAATAPTPPPSDGTMGGTETDDADSPSLWDYIERAEDAPPELQTVQESVELEEERAAERSFLEELARDSGPPVAFYTDPVQMLAVDPLHLDRVDPSEFDIPVVVNDDVVRWMQYFTGPGRKYYQRWLNRASRWQPMMREKLAALGLPEDLVYLSMIESGYNTSATSRAAAVGLWQFIASTARLYGLRTDWWVDERRDPLASTDAAVRLLSDLHKRFGDWYLAWAAYNAGPVRVERAIQAKGTKDFWKLADEGAFASETANYVPKIIAAAIIGKHPDRYGFTEIAHPDPIDVQAVTVSPSIGIDVLAKCAGISVAEFRSLNPQLRRWALPPSPKAQTIYLPAGQGDAFLAALAKVPPDQRLTWRQHTVRRGETLSLIARRYGVSTAALQQVNRIRNPNRIYPGTRLVIPVHGTVPPDTALTAVAGGRTSPHHRVTSITHVVRRGETLSAIAARYGVSQSNLMRWNHIRNADRIRAGQRLKIYDSTSHWTTYTVRRGDSLSAIARRYGCSVSDLKSWNHLTSSRIYAGQSLRLLKR